MLFAASVILLTAVPFGDAVLGTGALVGISPYLLLQWIVPVATETPELVVAFVLLTHGRGGQSVAVLLAGAVSQYTLALGTLPLAYLAGAGTGPLPLAGRERIELLLVDRRRALRRRRARQPAPEPRRRGDHARRCSRPSSCCPRSSRGWRWRSRSWRSRSTCSSHERRSVPALFAALFPLPDADRAAERGLEVAAVADAAVRVHGHELQPRHAAPARA